MRTLLATLASSTVAREAADKPAGLPVGSADAANPGNVATSPAKPAKLRKPKAAKPASDAKPVAPPAPVADAEPAVRTIGTARTAATIAANATSFGGVLSDRDQAYLAFFASFAGKRGTSTVTVSDIANSGRRPSYNGSNKPHDAGVVNRLRKAGLVTVAADGTSFTLTKAALSHAIVANVLRA